MIMAPRASQQITDPTEGVSLLAKSVSTLAMIPRREKITALGRRTYNTLMYIAQQMLRAGKDQEVYSAPLTDVVRLLQYDSKDLELIKKHLRAMVNTSVEWQSPTAGETADWQVCALLSQARLYPKSGQVWVDWAFAPALRQELLNPRVFAQLDLAVLALLRTHPAIFLYEIACRYRKVGKSPRAQWRWWHDPLTGRAPDPERLAKISYPIFKRDVLKPALAEVNAVTGFTLKLTEYKEGRSIGEIQFQIVEDARLTADPRKPPVKADMESVRLARDCGISDERVEQLVSEFGPDALASALPELKRRMETNFPEPVRDAYRYLAAVMPAHAVKAVATAAVEERKQDPTSIEARLVQGKRLQAYQTAFVNEKLQRLENELLSMDEAVRAGIVESVYTAMKSERAHPAVLKRFEQHGWTHKMIKTKVLRTYADAVMGPKWDNPSAEELLTIAAHMGDADIH